MINKDMGWVQYLPVGLKMCEVEREFIIQTLKRNKGSRTHSAIALGISPRTLRNRIVQYEVEGFYVPSVERKMT
jgi:DNA-binding NtrC family response regulator